MHYLTIIPLSEANSTISQSYFKLSSIGLEFSPFDEDALFLSQTNSNSIYICAQACHMMARCRTFNFDIQTKECRLYEGDVDSTGVLMASHEPQSKCGSIRLTANDFTEYGQICSSCEDNRYSTCINSTCQCQLHTYFNGSICLSQKVNGGECTDDIQCRNDLNLTCQSNMQYGYNSTSNCTASPITMATNISCNSSCLNQTWSTSANRLAEWLFDESYTDQMNNYNATPSNNMSFITTHSTAKVTTAKFAFPNVLINTQSCGLGGVHNSPYEGDMDDFRVYSRELSSDDVFTLYTN